MNIGTKLSAVKVAITSKAGRQILLGQKHSPAILFGTGVVGVVATTVLASKATLQLEDVLIENENKQRDARRLLEKHAPNYTATDYTRDMTILKSRLVTDIGRLYGPTIIVGVLSIGALAGSHVILNKRNAGLAAAYTALDKGFNEYRERVTALVGPEKERELRFDSETREVAKDTENGTEIETITTATGSGASPYAKFFCKDTSQSWSPQSEYNVFFLRSVQTYMNDKLRANGHLFLNEVYDALGLDRTTAGAVTGWVYNNKNGGDNYVDFGIFEDKNSERFIDFVHGREGGIWLDFNVDGVVYNLI